MIVIPIRRTTAIEGPTMKAKTKVKLSDLADWDKLTTLMWRLTVELYSNVPSLRSEVMISVRLWLTVPSLITVNIVSQCRTPSSCCSQPAR